MCREIFILGHESIEVWEEYSFLIPIQGTVKAVFDLLRGVLRTCDRTKHPLEEMISRLGEGAYIQLGIVQGHVGPIRYFRLCLQVDILIPLIDEVACVGVGRTPGEVLVYDGPANKSQIRKVSLNRDQSCTRTVGVPGVQSENLRKIIGAGGAVEVTLCSGILLETHC